MMTVYLDVPYSGTMSHGSLVGVINVFPAFGDGLPTGNGLVICGSVHDYEANRIQVCGVGVRHKRGYMCGDVEGT